MKANIREAKDLQGTSSSTFSGDPWLGLCVAFEDAVVSGRDVVLVTTKDEVEAAGASVSASFVVTYFSVVIVIGVVAAEEVIGDVLMDEVEVGV